MRLLLKVTALYTSAIAVVWLLFLSFGVADGVKYGKATVKPVPYMYLDISRALDPQYDIIQSQKETMIPRKPHNENPSDKVLVILFLALTTSFGILWWSLRRKLPPK